MAEILGLLTDKRGYILPSIKVIVRIATDPAGDTASDTTDSQGNYRMTVAFTSTVYNLFVTSEDGGTDGPNFSGQVISSGTAVGSFTLGTDSLFKIEHYGTGESETAGTHKQTNHDNITIRDGGFVETEDQFFEFRLGSTNRRLRIDASQGDSVFWFSPQPLTGTDNFDVGLREAFDNSKRVFWYGKSKIYFIDTNGDFNLNDGTFAGDVIANGTWNFTSDVIFQNTNFPRLNTYIAPTDDRDFAPKKYVDDQIFAGSLLGVTSWKEPVQVLTMISDTDGSGFPPESPFAGDAYIANNWGAGFIDDHIYEYDGNVWVDLGLIIAGTRVLVVDLGAGGSFAGQENDIGVYNGTTWDFFTPDDGWVTQIVGNGSFYEGLAYTFNTGDGMWVQFIGASQITAGTGLTKVGNTFNLDICAITDVLAMADDDDTLAICDVSSGITKKITAVNLMTGAGGISTAGTGLTKDGVTVHVGDGSTGDINGINRTADEIAAAVDDVTIEIASNLLQVKSDFKVAFEIKEPLAYTRGTGGADDVDFGFLEVEDVGGGIIEPFVLVTSNQASGEGFIDYFFVARGVVPASLIIRYEAGASATVDGFIFDVGGTQRGTTAGSSTSWADLTVAVAAGTWTAGSFFRVRLRANVDSAETVKAGLAKVGY